MNSSPTPSALRSFYSNTPLANIAFVVVMLLGLLSYLAMPREQDPEINFNWVSVTANLPGASAEEIERLVTNPLEDAVSKVADVRFVVSNSRENVSSLLVRFREIDERTFDKRMSDLRREIQNRSASELPREVDTPRIVEITTSNGFPTASLVLTGLADDETLRLQARRIKTDLERMSGVDQVLASGLRDPELLITPDSEALASRGLLATDLADSLAAWWRDTAGGTLRTRDGAWSVSIRGVNADPEQLRSVPIRSSTRPGASARLGDVARIERARAPASQYAAMDGRPAISMNLTKKSRTNTIELVERIRAYVDTQNSQLVGSGLRLELTDDQTVPTVEAISVMQTNAFYGALLVLLVCWLFLGGRIALLVVLGIPFSLLGSFAILAALGYTVNVSVLLGVVIALGMLVDDAVVVVESIYYRMARGQQPLDAAVDAVHETWRPVLSSVATTLAAFLPLMLLPGIVGKFMFVIPFVVTLALTISLLEAFWMMPAHVHAAAPRLDRSSRSQALRERFNRTIRRVHGQLLVKVLRWPKLLAAGGLLVVSAAIALVATGAVRVQFFAFDPIRAFYVNVDMPPSASLEDTLAETERIEAEVRQLLRGVGQGAEARAVTTLAGIKFTDAEIVYGDVYGQVFVSLNPRSAGSREVEAVVDSMRARIEALSGPGRKSFTVLSGGPPSGKPVNIKVRGDRFEEIERAAADLKAIVARIPGTSDVQDDNVPGRAQLQLRLDPDAIREAGLSPAQVSRLVRMAVDGEKIAFTRDEGDKLEVRIRSAEVRPGQLPADPASILDEAIVLPSGQITRLGSLANATTEPGRGFIRHYNLRRTITVEANLDKDVTDTREANQTVKREWEALRAAHPGVDLDFSGELEDIEESLAAMQVLFLLGVGLIYLILAAQFRSYFQPLMILVTVPLAFAGVAFGLALTANPLSLYTIYGVIALTGIAVNSAIVLIDAANSRMAAGVSPARAVVQASRRRVVPILITSSTTIGGLLSLAMGWGGKSLLWGPVASSIVWGLLFSTVLTLYIVPLFYLLFMRRSHLARTARPGSAAPNRPDPQFT
jgi:multidrug efflux pump subunit AcrB